MNTGIFVVFDIVANVHSITAAIGTRQCITRSIAPHNLQAVPVGRH